MPKLKALRDMPLVLPKDDFALTRTLRAKFDEAGFMPKIAAQSGHWDWLVAMACAGLGMPPLPGSGPAGICRAKATTTFAPTHGTGRLAGRSYPHWRQHHAL